MPLMNVLKPISLITDQSMGGNVTSKVINTQFLNEAYLQLLFTGTPTGTFTVETSGDYVPDDEFRTSPPNAGNWDALDLGTTLSATGAAGTISIDITLSAVPYLRVVYTRTSGTGTLNAKISGKTT